MDYSRMPAWWRTLALAAVVAVLATAASGVVPVASSAEPTGSQPEPVSVAGLPLPPTAPATGTCATFNSPVTGS